MVEATEKDTEIQSDNGNEGSQHTLTENCETEEKW
jgi:hypothetical protein